MTTSPTTSPLHYELLGRVALLRLDDGKANALTPAAVEAFHPALDRAADEAGAVVLAGRPGRFSAGFDLATLSSGPEAAVSLLEAGARLALRLYRHPQPVVAACTGHAIAMGAILLLVADRRIGAAGTAKIGLNEVAIGLTLPRFGVELARDRISKRHLTSAALLANLYDPAGACDAGFLDRIVPSERVVEDAVAEAERLAELDRAAFSGTKQRLRAASADAVEASLRADLEEVIAARR